ncbi:MAG TPA: hypothetical protein VFY45_12570 [Baekduia sp.]|nr:hypothetical protein [Baekduia sp.]
MRATDVQGVGPSGQLARRRALAVTLVVFATVAGLGLLTHKETPLAVDRATAIRLAAAAPETRVAAAHADKVMVIPIDRDIVKVAWLRHSRATATAGVRRDGTLTSPISYQKTAGYGTPLAHGLLLLGALTVLFLLATLRGPLRRRRTVDALALAAVVVPTVLIDRGLLALGEGIAAVLIGYLVIRGVQLALHGPKPDEDGDAPVLLERLAAHATLPKLSSQIGFLLLVLTVLMTVTSTGVVDVAYANMEGATVLLTGQLPYGHMPADVIHGDTYGLPIYVLYAPLAAIWPVHTDWDDALGALVLGAGAAILCALGMARAAGGGSSRWPAAIAVLALPMSLMTFSSGTNDVLIAAALIWAFAWWSRPAASSALLALAGLAKVAPLVLLPLWLARLRGAALLRALVACAAAGTLVLAGLVALGGLHGPGDMVHAMSFQLSRRSTMSIWTTLGIEPLQPLMAGIAPAIALGGATLVWLDRSVAADPRRIAGLVAATLGALQLAANHWAPLYLIWLAPPAMVALLGPLGARAAVRHAPATATAPTQLAAA